MKNRRQNKRKSYIDVNYLIRPKKQIERKIIIDILKRMEDIHSYNYIGMGSIYYYDFILLHKYLGIKRMISIDDKEDTKRFIFNKPFDFIIFKNMKTTEYFQKNKLKKKSIIWLDYDSMLFDIRLNSIERSILDDLDILAKQAGSNTFLIITIDVRPPKDLPQYRKLIESFGDYIPLEYHHITQDNYNRLRERYAYIIQESIIAFIEQAQVHMEIKYKKLFSFIYRDGAPMYTLGGILSGVENLEYITAHLTDAEFTNFDNADITNIDVPILTYLEKTYLDKNLIWIEKKLDNVETRRDERNLLKSLKFELESFDDLKLYLKYHRYYPQYYEGIV